MMELGGVKLWQNKNSQVKAQDMANQNMDECYQSTCDPENLRMCPTCKNDGPF